MTAPFDDVTTVPPSKAMQPGCAHEPKFDMPGAPGSWNFHATCADPGDRAAAGATELTHAPAAITTGAIRLALRLHISATMYKRYKWSCTWSIPLGLAC